VPIQIDAEVDVEGRQAQVRTLNLSLKGMLCKSDDIFRNDCPCRIALKLGPGIEINLEARIIRTDPDKTAIDFVGMDEDSFFHLRRIVEYNADDASKVKEEMKNPAFIAPTDSRRSS